MADGENAAPASKKRVAGVQLSKDNPEVDDDTSETEMGTFQRASEEVMATRRIVKVRRHQQPSAPSSNPFATIKFVPPNLEEQNKVKNDTGSEVNGTESGALLNEKEGKEENSGQSEDTTNEVTSKGDSTRLAEGGEAENGAKETVDEAEEEAGEETKAERTELEKTEAEKREAEEEKKDEEEKKEDEEGKKVDEDEKKDNQEEKKESEQKEKSASATPFSSFKEMSSSQNAFTGFAGTGFSASAFSFGSVSGEGSTFAGTLNNSTSEPHKSSTVSMQQVPVETGEENEKSVFTADAVLFEYLEGGWKEKGKGELKLNVSKSSDEKARLVMRAKGIYKLILNASLYPDMSLKDMDKRGVSFACLNSAGEGKEGLNTFALKFKDSGIREEFHVAVAAHKGEKGLVLKTPENSPKASDE
ncbi:Nuclear pore complex protein NUP50B [Ananas comosus]|uniref:Nuclear pore complex protein NUP50B n=1 Tax=Ananas comosus TaxID=4615 RepID=A0A199VSW4_ANACO|nr:Nuclear pore complex protein NUP50B [Ananas comosus]